MKLLVRSQTANGRTRLKANFNISQNICEILDHEQLESNLMAVQH